MRVKDCVGCELFPCTDVNHGSYIVPGVDVEPERISIVLISEAAPADPDDYYYAGEDSSFQQTTVQVFKEAGADVATIQDIVNLGVYLTTAVKCGKTGYGIEATTIKVCSVILEQELALFPHVKAYLLMGDVAIKALNYVAKRAGAGKVIPTGSTYRIRGHEYYFRGGRAFPSYLQAGPSFNIEKSKRKMITEDIASALRLIDTWTNH